MSPGIRFVFGRFEFDQAQWRLLKGGQPLAIRSRHLDVLFLMVTRAAEILSKDELLAAGWKDVAVGDNSLEQAISALRRILGKDPEGRDYIETVPRRGYRFTAHVDRLVARASDEAFDALLLPYRALVEGRNALETLDPGSIARARVRFEEQLSRLPDDPSVHVGLANAYVLQFEITRADLVPDHAALTSSLKHAREACRLNAELAEAWSTLGFVLQRTGSRTEAQAAGKRAVALEPNNWRHHLRLATVSWGEERLRAARQALLCLPNSPLAQWLAATVHVARQALSHAERELTEGLARMPTLNPPGRFRAAGLHWMRGLIALSGGDDAGALQDFEDELSYEMCGQLYARECAANTWYAIGAVKLRQGRLTEAQMAFQQAIARVGRHPMAHAGLAALGAATAAGDASAPVRVESVGLNPASVDAAVFEAGQRALAGAHQEAADIVEQSLRAAEVTDYGWSIPIEPLLNVSARPHVWRRVLAVLSERAA